MPKPRVLDRPRVGLILMINPNLLRNPWGPYRCRRRCRVTRTGCAKRRLSLNATSPPLAVRLSRVKLFLALSRTPHGLLDLATPALAALLWLGGLPPLGVIALGLLTVFAGYTAVYALNDVVDYRVDQAKLEAAGDGPKAGYLDALFMRHPMAQGQVSFGEGLLWTAAWAAMALAGAYRLNPVCAYIFLAGCLLEAVYCRLLRVSHLRTLVSGLVKTLGGVAAVFAVDPHPAPRVPAPPVSVALLLGDRGAEYPRRLA